MYVYECMHVGWHFPRPTAAQLEGREKLQKKGFHVVQSSKVGW